MDNPPDPRPVLLHELSPFIRADGRKRKRGRFFCPCGLKFVARVEDVRSGNTLSCGCLRKRKIAALNYKHGYSDTPTFKTWAAMIRRCSDKNQWNYRYYGAQGIRVSLQWLSFVNFLQDMGERPKGKTIDRINPYGDYELKNCRWATAKEQQRNRRKYGRN